MGTAIAYAAVGLVLFLAAALPMSPVFEMLRRQGGGPAFYSFVLALLGLGLLHLHWTEGGELALLGLVTLAAALVALALDGRDNGAVRYLAYGVFACEVLYLSFVTIDSMLGTSAFFLLAGLVVAVLALVMVRLEKLFAKRVAEVRA